LAADVVGQVKQLKCFSQAKLAGLKHERIILCPVGNVDTHQVRAVDAFHHQIKAQPQVQAGWIQQVFIEWDDHFALPAPGLDLPITQDCHPETTKGNPT
jgi:hypothetical protein